MEIEDFEMREFNSGCRVVTQNLLLNYSLFKIIVNPSRKIEFSSEKQKDMSDDGSHNLIELISNFYSLWAICYFDEKNHISLMKL